MQEPLCIDKLIQGLKLYTKVYCRDSFYLYCELIYSLRYGKSIKEGVGMHVIENISSCYYDNYKWCKICDYIA